MSYLKIGDRVMTKEKYFSGRIAELLEGKIGVVVHVNVREISVEFNEDFGGHSAFGRGKYGHCWNIFDKYLTKLPDSQLIEKMSLIFE